METIDFLLDRPVALIIVLAIGALIGATVERTLEGFDREKRRAYWRGRNAAKGSGKGNRPGPATQKEPEAQRADLAADQLKAVMAAKFMPRPLLNRPEAAVFKALDAAVIARNPGWQVMAQVSLGEFLGSSDKDAFAAINSKRVDFALMDEQACVRHVIEYQGTGHHQVGGAAAARDAVKKEAVRKAGIGYHEVVAGHTTPAELKALVARLVVAG